MARETNTSSKTTKTTMIPKENLELGTTPQDTPPQLTANDIAILYKLAQQATIKVTDIDVVSNVMDKCNRLFGSIK
jgi:hypothetical protein